MGSRRYLVTSGLPYSNGRLHVGHIAGAYLPADIFVRYLRATGAEVRFICGSDDNGVAALKTAREQGRTVEELTAFFNESQRRSFEGLNIRFDIYGGTHQPDFVELHEKISQELFRTIYEKGYFTKRSTRQLFDVQANQFLPDRYVKGRCPHCGSSNAYGDQCEGCGKSLDALDLIDPISTMTQSRPETRETVHWYLRLDKVEDRLRAWLETKRETWRATVTNFALGQMNPSIEARFETPDQAGDVRGRLPGHTAEPVGANPCHVRLRFGSRADCDRAAAMLAESGVASERSGGLPERAMTRDLTWGVPVPLDDPDAKGKVLYVWFDAPVGYVSFTAKMCERMGEGWQAYEHWWKSRDCEIYHFIGEDNTVFHAVIWPAMLLASHDGDSRAAAEGEYQLPTNVVANSFLNIKFPGKEEEKISKSRGTAIWIEDYLKTFDPDPLRYYLTAIAPESQRTTFDVDEFIARNNGELLAALGNFVNRTMTFAHRYFDGRVPAAGTRDDVDRAQMERCRRTVDEVAVELEECRFRSALGRLMQLARDANGYFDATAPFRTRKTDMAACGRAINVCLQTCRTMSTIMDPFLPDSAEKCRRMLTLDEPAKRWDSACEELRDGAALGGAVMLFKKLDAVELFGT
ncbi:MAG: class I tRNA ligase family protein [Phycisphaerales bacterium]|nr:class I tRNA ligase family protein [Phycisphaerales bacterium]